jgi:hypothetical protein
MAEERIYVEPALKKSPQRIGIIVAALKAGNSRATAAKLAGISRSRLYYWLQHDAAFKQAVRLAEAEREAKDIVQITEAGKLDWRAIAWLLERRNRADWGRKEDVTLNLRDLQNLTDAQLLELEARITEGEGAAEPFSDDDEL